jgi:hypothetical protein
MIVRQSHDYGDVRDYARVMTIPVPAVPLKASHLLLEAAIPVH